jgi:hypothetical protein
MPEESLEIVEQSGLIVTMAESGRAVAFLPLVTRDCPLAHYVPSLLALPTSKLALLCPILSQSALPEAYSRKDFLRRLVVAAVGEALRQQVETLVAHAVRYILDLHYPARRLDLRMLLSSLDTHVGFVCRSPHRDRF